MRRFRSRRATMFQTAMASSLCRRTFCSTPPQRLNPIEPSELSVTLTTSPKPKLPNDKLMFGKAFSDHMLDIDWDNTYGWHAPRIQPYGSFQADPAWSVFHYALEAFEGMKAYVDQDEQIRLFRPLQNMRRLNRSCEALYFPTFDEDAMMQCLIELLRIEKDWIPREYGYSLYIRPTIISTHPYVGVAPAEQVKLYVILSPVGPYYATGFSAVKLLADTEHIRAWPKGVGNMKLGSNYGPTIRAQREAAAKGYAQVLWLFGDEHNVTEVGTMNQFFLWHRPEDGEKELVTCPLDGTILPGVTRDCILQLCRDWGEFHVTERQYTMREVAEAADDGRVIESFGAGTAAIVSPVKQISYLGKDYDIPLDPEKPEEEAGPLARRLFETIMHIQYGLTPHPWSVVV